MMPIYGRRDKIVIEQNVSCHTYLKVYTQPSASIQSSPKNNNWCKNYYTILNKRIKIKRCSSNIKLISISITDHFQLNALRFLVGCIVEERKEWCREQQEKQQQEQKQQQSEKNNKHVIFYKKRYGRYFELYF